MKKIIMILILAGGLFAEDALTWEACVKEALSNSPEIKSAAEKVKQAEQDLLTALSAGALQVSASLSENNSFSLTSGNFNWSTGYSLSGRYTLYDGNQYRYDVNAAKERLSAAKNTYESTSAVLRFGLKSAFLDLFKTQELITITEDIKKRRKDNYEMVKLSYEAGREHKGSVLLAEANLKQAEYEVTAAKRNLDLTSLKLSRQLGRKDETNLRISYKIETKALGQEKPEFKKLMENTPSYKQYVSAKFLADYSLKSAQAAFSPQISLSGSAGKSTSELAFGTAPDLSAGLSLSLTLFDGGRREAQTTKAFSQFLQADLDLIAAGFDVETALYTAWNNLCNAIDQVGVRKLFLEATMERAKISEVQYSNGLIGFDNWTLIEDDMANSQKSLLDASINSLSAENAWQNAQGVSFENSGIK